MLKTDLTHFFKLALPRIIRGRIQSILLKNELQHFVFCILNDPKLLFPGECSLFHHHKITGFCL